MALRSLAAKMRIPVAAASAARLPSAPRVSPASASRALPFSSSSSSSSSSIKGELENALRVKNNIESAKEVDLFSSADVLTKHRQQAEQIVRQISESHGRVSERMRKSTVRFACASVVVALLDWYCFQDEDEILEREIELLLRD